MNITMKELARRAGVSRQAVSAALTHNENSRAKVSAKTRDKILSLALEFDFVPNRAAMELSGVPNRLIGMIAMPRNSGISVILQTEIITRFQNYGYEILTSNMSMGNIDWNAKLTEFRARRVEGIMALSAPAPFEQSDSSGVPIVYCSALNHGDFDVGTDREDGGYQAAKHLIEHGRKKLYYLSLERGAYNQDKFWGISRAMREGGLPVTDKNFLSCEDIGSSAAEVVKYLREIKPDSIVCANDFIAAKILIALSKIGVRVPDDIAVIGFDGYSFCDYAPISLTTVVQPIRKQAETAVALLIDRIGKGEHRAELANIRLKPKLRLAASCGCNPSIADELDEADSVLVLDPEGSCDENGV